VQIRIERGVDQIAGASFSVGLLASALYVRDTNTGEQASSGTVAITRVSTDYKIDGVADFQFPSRHVHGTFTAQFVFDASLCG
jgi:hypothetical protein